ncbi:MAG: sigma-54-dependent Fis family transcriptional regulator, partial [Alphaproteobacteria bacterium]|nr:sigma-54-dependent Fis family transcriptional regulator [Alphaproteobacteria bacterium]
MTSTILIADDDPVQRRLLEAMTRRFGYEAETVESGEQAIARLTQIGAKPIALLILDLVMPDLDGMGVLTRMRDMKLATPVIVQTAHGSIETVISAMRAGAHDFVVKPVGAERLQISIKNALSADALADEVRRISRRAQGALTFKDLVSRSDDMARVIRLGQRA